MQNPFPSGSLSTVQVSGLSREAGILSHRDQPGSGVNKLLYLGLYGPRRYPTTRCRTVGLPRQACQLIVSALGGQNGLRRGRRAALPCALGPTSQGPPGPRACSAAGCPCAALSRGEAD